jgi:hypothetical protein
MSSAEMPKYKCNKEVWGLKIKSIELIEGGAILTPCDDGYLPFEVDDEYIKKHNPHVSGYYVVYKDGYQSFSPAHAFEDGYTRIN